MGVIRNQSVQRNASSSPYTLYYNTYFLIRQHKFLKEGHFLEKFYFQELRILEKSKSFWKDSAILLISAVITKVFGAFFKITLTNVLGGTGMRYFSSAYGLLLPIYALSVTGLSAFISQAVARSAAMGNFAEVKRIHRIGEISCGILGVILSVIIFVLAKPFSVQIAAQPYAVFSVLAIAPAALFGCLTAVERGYWEGLQNLTPTAVSQAIEALVNLGLGLYFCQ